MINLTVVMDTYRQGLTPEVNCCAVNELEPLSKDIATDNYPRRPDEYYSGSADHSFGQPGTKSLAAKRLL